MPLYITIETYEARRSRMEKTLKIRRVVESRQLSGLRICGVGSSRGAPVNHLTLSGALIKQVFTRTRGYLLRASLSTIDERRVLYYLTLFPWVVTVVTIIGPLVQHQG